MNRLFVVTAALVTAACAHLAAHAGETAKKPAKPSTKKSAKSQSSHAEKAERGAGRVASARKTDIKVARATSAKKADAMRASAAAEAALEPPVSDSQLEIASRVLTGLARCEFNQTVRVEPQHDRPGHFRVAFNNVAYTMVPEETTTGAVRLHDAKAGLVWLQIPTKSMLMNARVGQRVVDACMQAEQRIAAGESQAGNALGWSTPVPAAPAIAASLALPAAQAAIPAPPVSALAAAVPPVSAPITTLAAAPEAPAQSAPAANDAAAPAAPLPAENASPASADSRR